MSDPLHAVLSKAIPEHLWLLNHGHPQGQRPSSDKTMLVIVMLTAGMDAARALSAFGEW